MILCNKIKHLVSSYIVSIWPHQQHEPHGKPIDIKNDSVLLLFQYFNSNKFKEIENVVKGSQSKFNKPTIAAFSSGNIQFAENKSENILHISDQDFNIIGNPKGKLQKWLSENRFDVMLSFTEVDCLFCNSFINNLEADFKVGIYSKNTVNQFDLTIAHELLKLEDQLDNYIYYLKNLNINK